MAPYMSVDRAYQSYGPVNKEALSRQLSRSERGLLRLGLVKPEQWRQQPTEALYQVVISEVLDDGQTQHLERGGGRAFAVAAVLDLGLRMLESPRGRDALESLARKAIRVWGQRPAPVPVHEPSKGDISRAVDDFLRSVRFRFPLVKLDDRNGFCHEEDTSRMFDYQVDEFSTLEQFNFDPKAAAVLHLNWQLVEKLYWTRLKADVARRHRREDEQTAQPERFHRLQFHLAAMVAHHLCHLFVNFLRGFEALAGARVADADFMRLVRRYDPGAEFEVDFFGGRPKLFIDHSGPRDESYAGRSYLVRRGGSNDRRIAAAVPQHKIERYLRGDFSAPLLTEVEGAVSPMERYQDVKRRYGVSKHESWQWREGATGGTRRRVADVGSPSQQSPGVPWNIQGAEYRMLKRACFDPAIRMVDFRGF